ncbi:MAG TPA: ornithine cyclodeaminase family protein [bacterium]|nr:ornithine cyclodeaminase family protein [bacterium]
MRDSRALEGKHARAGEGGTRPKTIAMTLLLRESEVRALLSMEDAIGLMADALQVFSTGGVEQPVRLAMVIPAHDGYLGLMPAQIRAAPADAGRLDEALGAKAVTFFPHNAARDLPTILSIVLLWDSATGDLLALMDGRLITEVRTAATSAVATRVLARPDARVLGVLGAGVQARSHLEALALTRPLRQVRIWSRTLASVQRLIAQMPPRIGGVPLVACATAEEAARGADIIVTATASATPVLAGKWIAPGAHINAVGAPQPNMRELDTAAVRGARLYVDSRAGALAESGDVMIPIAEKAIGPDHIIGEIGEVLAGKVSGRTSDRDITLFKSLGMAVEDVATAQYIYSRARQHGVGRQIDFR